MRGAELVIETAKSAGLELCLANPGTTEMPIVQALDSRGGIRSVLCLHENVASGAADGYGRLTGRPALVLLHLGPGLANAGANLHNARRARAPIVNLVGEHATWHMAADPPLAMDIERLAGCFSVWTGRTVSAADSARCTANAIAAAISGNGGVATLVLPHDHQLDDAGVASPVPAAPVAAAPPEGGEVDRAAAVLRAGGPSVLFLGGKALFGEGLRLAGRISAATGCLLLGEVGFARLETGRGLPAVRRLPYFPELAQTLLDERRGIVGVGAKNPVTFFGWPGHRGRYLEQRDDVVWLAGQDQDALAALAMLADALDAHADLHPADAEIPALPSGRLDAESIGGALAALLPEDAIVVPTAVSSTYPFSAAAPRAARHTELALTGGAIGEGMALALGAALAEPERPVINLEADGSAAYLMPALWSQARERLNIITIICSNRAYRILQLELERAGQGNPGRHASALTRLDDPPIDWAQIARAQGVAGTTARTVDEFARTFRAALQEGGPHLIDAVL